jgi:hypothetical protein
VGGFWHGDGWGIVGGFWHGDGRGREDVFIGLFFADLGHGSEGVIGGTRTGAHH